MRDGMARRYSAAFIGTFGIVFAPVALSASGRFPGGDGGLMAAAWVSGRAVLAMIYALGPISAAHFNPAVTLGFVVAGRFPLRYMLPYWLAQFGSGCLHGAFRGRRGADALLDLCRRPRPGRGHRVTVLRSPAWGRGTRAGRSQRPLRRFRSSHAPGKRIGLESAWWNAFASGIMTHAYPYYALPLLFF
jgi:hypothetical protein